MSCRLLPLRRSDDGLVGVVEMVVVRSDPAAVAHRRRSAAAARISIVMVVDPIVVGAPIFVTLVKTRL